LKLVRGELNNSYGTENGSLRELGAHLSELRDAGAIIQTFDAIVEKHKAKLAAGALTPIRRGLQLRKRENEERLNVARVMVAAAKGLGAVRRRVSKWPVKADGFDALAVGLKSTYRDGRKAMRLALKTEEPEDYHELRKRAKDHWYHIRLMEALWTELMEAREHSLHDLETWLGDDHNLVVLCDQLEQDPERYGGGNAVQMFTALAHEEQNDLRARSKALGERIYEEKPNEFVRNLSKLWDIWQDAPKALSH
jgi:CHAD domain-containing protein